jgi:hypothetical protein
VTEQHETTRSTKGLRRLLVALLVLVVLAVAAGLTLSRISADQSASQMARDYLTHSNSQAREMVFQVFLV